MKNILILMLFCCFISCKNEVIQLPSSVFVKAKLTNHGISVFLSKALASDKEYSFEGDNAFFYVNDAQVFLYENDVKLFTLKFAKKGVYSFLDSTWSAKVGKQYKILINSTEFGTIESDNVAFPKPTKVNDISYTFEPNNDLINHSNAPQVNLTINFAPNQNIDSSYYEMAVAGERKDGLKLRGLSFTDYYYKFLEKNKSYYNYYYDNFGNNIFNYTSAYFSNGIVSNNILYMEYIMEGQNPSIISNGEVVEKMTMRVNTISKSAIEYSKAIQAQDDIDERFQEMPPSYTNIKNGIGIFYAVNEGDKIFTIKP